jgi:virginiamycin B lyase
MWFTQLTGNSIGRITTAGIVTEFPFTTPGAGPFGMAAGVDGNMWFSLRNTSQVGSVGTGFLLGSGR